MGKPPAHFHMIGHRMYAEFAEALRLSPLGIHLKFNERIVGWRTNRRAYVDPQFYFKVFGKYPPGAQGSNRSQRTTLSTVPSENRRLTRAVACPTCKTSAKVKKVDAGYKCGTCGTAFAY